MTFINNSSLLSPSAAQLPGPLAGPGENLFEMRISSRDYWFKVVEMLQQNSALIEPAERAVTVFEAYYRAILVDTGRVMVLLCYNSDFGDAWEWSLSEDCPREIIEEQALPLSLDIAVYALTH